MATRDLTRRFNDYRTTAKIIGRNSLSPLGGYSMDSSLLEDASSANGWQAARLQLPAVWVDMVDKIDAITAQLEVKMKNLADLHRKRLLVGFDDTEATKERDIEYHTQEVTEMFRDAENVLKKLPTANSDGPDWAVTRNIQKSMARRMQILSLHFRRDQKEYMTQLKAQKTGTQVFDFLAADNDRLQAEKRYREKGLAGFTAEQLMMLEEQETQTNERDQEIQHIAKSIEELSQIFKELAVLVIDQGTVLDRIDFNMEQVVEHTKEGVSQLVKAEENQKAATATRCIIGLLIAISIMIIILIIKHS